MEKFKSIYIWGAGYFGTLTAINYKQKNINILGFIDSNASQIKTKLELPVLTPEDFAKTADSNAVVLIAIDNENAIKEISKKLESWGFDFTISELIMQHHQLWKPILSEKLETKDAFNLIYKKNLWASLESRSGKGSHVNTTETLRNALPELWEKYSVKTFLDAPCGDYNWMKLVNKENIEYLGIDIVEEVIESNKKYEDKNVKFKVLDIIRDELPKVDMILCKDCLQHLSFSNVHKALNNFKRSGSKYLLVTSYQLTKINQDINDGDYRPLNLFIEPFNLKEPLYELLEESDASGVKDGRTVYLFDLEIY